MGTFQTKQKEGVAEWIEKLIIAENKSPKIFHSDNGGEFVNEVCIFFDSFFFFYFQILQIQLIEI